ncbi:MAG: diacylglycerol kinase family lipid kinase [Clostridiales bacterium]|nr:diacylglycerol kinase family lipid kinase [Clostridiales bacterium]
MRPYFIVNPIAGGGEGAAKFEKVKQFLDSRHIEYGCSVTEKAGESTELADKAYENGERFIVAVGGDGTINEVASSLYTKNDVTMGICPFGTGNDFARVLGLSTDPDIAAETIVSGVPRPIDMGLANGRPFTNVGGLGFDVDVLINTEKYKGRFKGMLPYLLGILKSMSHLNRFPVKVTADGNTIEEKALLLAVGNGSHFGGGMAALPKASATDGLFDVCVVKGVGFFTFIKLLPLFIKGKHLGKKPVTYFKAREVRIECEKKLLQLDGELVEYAPVTFSLLPGALKIMLPAAK